MRKPTKRTKRVMGPVNRDLRLQTSRRGGRAQPSDGNSVGRSCHLAARVRPGAFRIHDVRHTGGRQSRGFHPEVSDHFRAARKTNCITEAEPRSKDIPEPGAEIGRSYQCTAAGRTLILVQSERVEEAEG